MQIISGLLLFIVVAILGESLWETGKMLWQDGKLNIDRLGALVVGLVLSVGLQIDLFGALGVPFKYPYVGMILTGILLSRGANFIHDLLVKIQGVKLATEKVITPPVDDAIPVDTKPPDLTVPTDTTARSDTNIKGLG